MKVRRAEFAGSWYPGNPKACEKEIKSYLAETFDSEDLGRDAVGGIVPHAGWFFSGSIACQVIEKLARSNPADVFLVFGMHLHPGSPRYTMVEGAWETPFGNLPIAEALARELVEKYDFSIETTDQYNRDNTIELQLPFIKYFQDKAQIVPMGVPPTAESLKIGEDAVDIAKKMGLNVKIVGSTDLTHYGLNYGFSPKGVGNEALDWVKSENDRRVIEAMLKMDPETIIREGLKNQNACCAGAAATAVAAGRRMGAENAAQMAYATSHDKSPGDSFVGYVGIVF